MGDKKFKVGDKVKYINTDHAEHPDFYPLYGTIGEIKEDCGDSYCVQWPKGSTSDDDCWCCNESDLEAVKINKNEMIWKINDMTNEEIWEMLESKMRKNGLVSSIYSCTKVNENGAPCFYLEGAYKEDDVHNAVALAYKIGYLRAMKGRPFKIGEKKKKKCGRWVPVDPNNLPKEGTRVRYSRECKEYRGCNSEIIIGDTGIIKFEGLKHDWFGMKPDNPRNLYYNWLSFDSSIASCLDMWVEDDE